MAKPLTKQPATKRAAKKALGRHPLAQPEWHAKAKALLLEGQSMAQVAEQVGVSRQAVYKFYDRHRDDIAGQRQAAAELVRDASIRAKAERIRRAADLVDRMHQVIETRGLMAQEPKWITSYMGMGEPPTGPKGGEIPTKQDKDGTFLVAAGQVLTSVEKFDAALVREYREMMQYVAEELGEMPKAGVNFNLSNVNNTAVLDMSNFSAADKAKVLLMALEMYRRPA